MRWSLTVTYRAPESSQVGTGCIRYSPNPCAEKSANTRGHRMLSTGSSGAQRSHTQGGSQTVCTPDPYHRTHPERPVLSVRDTHWGQATPDTQTRSSRRPVPGVRCLTLAERGTDSTPDAQTQCPVPPRPASDECFSPTTSPNFHRRNRKNALYFLKKRRIPLWCLDHQNQNPKQYLCLDLHWVLFFSFFFSKLSTWSSCSHHHHPNDPLLLYHLACTNLIKSTYT